MVGEIEALFEQVIQVGRPGGLGSLACMREHILDDAVGAIAVRLDLGEHVLDGRELTECLVALSRIELLNGCIEPFLELLEKLHRDFGEIHDEVERILDFVRHTGRQLTE